MLRRTYIYGLLCPIQNKIRYVGKADRPVERLQSHLSEMRCWLDRRANYTTQRGYANNSKLRWLAELDQQGETPELVILQTLPWEARTVPICEAAWRTAELRWIDLLASNGHPLLNREARPPTEHFLCEAVQRGREVVAVLGVAPGALRAK